MAKKTSSKRSSSASRKRKRRSSTSSWIIPVIVGVVVVAVIVGAIVSLGGQPDAADASGQVSTAGAQSTTSLPYPDVQRISLEETTQKMESGEAVLVDVRSRSSYDNAHAAGAISVPEDEVDARLSELPRDKLLIFYCT
jgi:flagellar basal body-associated protein FliL